MKSSTVKRGRPGVQINFQGVLYGSIKEAGAAYAKEFGVNQHTALSCIRAITGHKSHVSTSKGIPVCVHGIVYPSIAEAARKLAPEAGVSVGSMKVYIRNRVRLGEPGYEYASATKKSVVTAGRPIMYDGVRYDSVSALAIEHTKTNDYSLKHNRELITALVKFGLPGFGYV